MNHYRHAGWMISGGTLGALLVGVAEGLYLGTPVLLSAAFYAALWSTAFLGAALCVWPIQRRWGLGRRLYFAVGMTGSLAVSTGAITLHTYVKEVQSQAAGNVWLAIAWAAGATAMAAGGAVLVSVLLPRWFVRRGVRDYLVWTAPVCAWLVLYVSSLFFADIVQRSSGCENLSEPVKESNGRQGVLVIADTLRSDAIGAYRHTNAVDSTRSPRIDSFAGESVLFEDASAQASWTKPAVLSILTGRTPVGHQVLGLTDGLPAEVPTLMDVLKDAHVPTIAVVGNPNFPPNSNTASEFDCFVFLPQHPLRRLVGYKAFGALTGILIYPPWGPGNLVNKEARRLLDEVADRDFFMWVHYMEPHAPYFDRNGHAHMPSWLSTVEELQAMRPAYLDEVSRVDTYFGEIVDHLKELDIYDTMSVTFMSDHGEEFGEHGLWEHGKTLYEEQLRIPLMIKPPQGVARRESGLARQIDLAPTWLATWGLRAPPSWEGGDLFREAASMTTAQIAGVFSARSEVDGRQMKTILSDGEISRQRGLDPIEVYDLGEDPDERASLADREGATEQLVNTARRTREHLLEGAADAATEEPDEETLEQLEALGYVE